MSQNSSRDLETCQALVDEAVSKNQLTPSAAENIHIWLTDPGYQEYVSLLVDHVKQGEWQVLDDVFWTVIPFGTGGRRGRMYPIGSNAINDRTIGESAQGLAEYVRQTKPDGPWSAAIAYDTRHRSREFAELCAGILVANGFRVFFLDDFRSTPELSFLIRWKECDCGLMVTASHNPPSDNAVKVYWSNGAQLIPPHDQAVIEQVSQVQQIEVADFETAVQEGGVVFCREETDQAFLQAHLQQSMEGPRDLQIIYSPLHGVGEYNVKSLLNEVGFHNVEIYEPHRRPDGDFPNVPGHVSNPENAEVFTEIIARARQVQADLIMASDPDCDRLGAAAPLTMDTRGEWKTFNGNQLGVLLAEFLLADRQERGELDPRQFLVTTLVTTQMANQIAQSYGVRCFSNNLVGFKWICNVIDRQGPDDFLFGFEESHGYLVGQYCRDKDGAVACMLMSQLAAKVKAEGISLHQYLDQLYQKYGYYVESLVTIQMEGSDGMRRMSALMDKFRTAMPDRLGDLDVVRRRDYLEGLTVTSSGAEEPLDGPTYNLVFLDTEVAGNYVAARPSGTEPKVKFYLFAHVPPDELDDLAAAKREMADRIRGFERTLQELADSV
ncbi:MAG: phospho-sugar mutase [Planctomycetota bacterium]|nr:phospho-sugar mutase [Planctomycetota bacterium]